MINKLNNKKILNIKAVKKIKKNNITYFYNKISSTHTKLEENKRKKHMIIRYIYE